MEKMIDAHSSQIQVYKKNYIQQIEKLESDGKKWEQLYNEQLLELKQLKLEHQ